MNIGGFGSENPLAMVMQQNAQARIQQAQMSAEERRKRQEALQQGLSALYEDLRRPSAAQAYMLAGQSPSSNLTI